MAEFTYETGDDFSDGGFLNTPGWYHLIVSDFEYPALDKDRRMLDWALFKVTCEVLAGTVTGQGGKLATITVGAPKPSDRDGGKFRKRVVDRFLLATAVTSESDKNKRVSFDPKHIIGRQFVAHLELGEREGKPTKFLEFQGCEIYHVDDDVAKSHPLRQDSIAMLPAAWRRTAKPSAAVSPAPSVDEIVGVL